MTKTTMNRIDATFETLRKQGRKALIGYLTAGDPDVERSFDNIMTAVRGGLDVLELGVPFSDPTADGPTIQVAAQRALASGMTVGGVLDLVRRLRVESEIPVVLFGYANPFFRYGYERVCADAAESGADGMLVVDLPFEESAELKPHMTRHGLQFIPLIAPTTPGERVAAMLKDAGGFVYYIMVTGVTGARQSVAADVREHVEGVRKVTPLPVAVGFGVSSGTQAREAADAADAVVVGSALVQAAQDGRLETLVRELRQALET